MYKSTFICLSYLVLLLMSSACKQEQEAAQEDSRGPLKVDGTLVETSVFNRTLSTTANLLPFEEVELQAPLAGNVMAIYFEEGEQVQQGQRLIRIDDRSWRAQLQGLQAELRSAQSELERNRQLLEREGISQEELEQAEAVVRNLEARMREIQVNIKLANVQAPMSGVVGMRNFSLGDYLQQGQAITRLVQKDKLRVDFAIPAEYAAQLEEEQEVSIIASASGDTSRAVIYAVSPAVNMATREVQVRALLENTDDKFLAGDFAEVRISVTEDEEALLIPAEAVIPEVDKHVVYKVENGKAVKQEVELGRRTPAEIQILQGLSEGDTIMLTGLMEVEDGSEVEVEALKDKAL